MTGGIQFILHGSDMQLVEVTLAPGQGIQAEVGAMVFMGDGIEMQTGTGGGIFAGLKRMLGGENFFVSRFVQAGDRPGQVAFGAPYPGKIVPLELSDLGGEALCQKDSFLCAADGIDIGIAFSKRLGAGLFGGEGFILQSLKGSGLAFLHAGGTILQKDLAAGEVLRVDTGCLVAMGAEVDYNIKFVGGFTNVLFGGEGLFLARLRGPGRVYLQSLPLARLAGRLQTIIKPGILAELTEGKD